MSQATIVPQDKALPTTITLFPFTSRPIFPGIFTPLMLDDPEDIKTVEAAMDQDGIIGFLLQKNETDTPTVADLYKIGTVARVVKKIHLPDGGLNLFLSTIKRFKVKRTLNAGRPMKAIVEYIDDEEDDSFEVKALTRALISEMKLISENNPLFSEEMRVNMVNIDHPGKIADFITSILNIEKEDMQRVLEMINVRQRMETVLMFIKKEQEVLRIQKKIQNELNERVEKNQREYFLREELKAIKEELGMATDARSQEYLKFKEKIDSFHFEGEIKETVDSELEKFQMMEPSSSEYIVSRNYLETICNLPWQEPDAENYNIAEAKKILEADHYGMDDVKKRIMEYLAVRKLKGDSKGSIILLVGPPGVGKTSVGKSIARAMNKPFYRFSVGGLRDEAEIKGHRRTYVGAMPGKIIQGLKIVKTKAPVFMIDEIDKMGESHQGDPASALLEVLDPEQNVTFRDSYLDLPFDVSDILFVLTANTLDTIPEPLLDRAEIIQLSGYIDQEKLEIGKQYLLPKSLEKNGLKKNQVKYGKDALLTIANEYAREAGVRNFEKNLDKIHRKYAAELIASDAVLSAQSVLDEALAAEGATEKTPAVKEARKALQKALAAPLTVTKEDIEKYLGKPVFDESEILRADKPGTAVGLAWTSMGGDTLLIESMSTNAGGGAAGLQLTGQLGDVMKESSSIAYSWVRSYAIANKLVKPDWFNKNLIHLHVPDGATPKDGPSAGITMATALMSLLKGKKIRKDLAMTGELSLTGKVLPIGGLKEKTVAAKRNNVKTIIIPKQNERDLDEIPEIVKKGITFKPVSRIEEVLEIAFNK
ncbi:MAG: endopeptidase La [Treponemataceae bacterium]|nr:endopeptidase La [Treponemataceae bacterium]